MRNRLFLLVSLVLSLYRPAVATTIYAYTGNDFTNVQSPYSTSEFVHGSFTVAAPLAGGLSLQVVSPVSFSFTDGSYTIDNTNSRPSSSFEISTDATGAITGWLIEIQNIHYQEIESEKIPTFAEDYDDNSSASAYNQNSPGTWTVTTAPAASASTPEPSSLLLLATGLTSCAELVRRRRVA